MGSRWRDVGEGLLGRLGEQPYPYRFEGAKKLRVAEGERRRYFEYEENQYERRQHRRTNRLFRTPQRAVMAGSAIELSHCASIVSRISYCPRLT